MVQLLSAGGVLRVATECHNGVGWGRGTKEFAVCRLDKSILQALPNWARESPRVELRCVCVILLICKTHGSIERGGCPIEMQAVDDVV